MAEAGRQHDGADTGLISEWIDSSAGEKKGEKKRLNENFLSRSLF